MTWCRCGTPSQSSSSSAPPSAPQAQAIVHDVVGRRTPIAARSRPVSALNVEDLPEPVAPASATTVWSPESRSRAPARSATARGLRRPASSSSRPRQASAASSSPSIRSATSERLGPTERASARHQSPVAPHVAASLGRALLGGGGPLSAKRRSSTRAGHLAQPLDGAVVGRRASSSTSRKRARSASISSATRWLRSVRAAVGQPAYGLVAEDRLEQLLADHARCRRRCRPRRR